MSNPLKDMPSLFPSVSREWESWKELYEYIWEYKMLNNHFVPTREPFPSMLCRHEVTTGPNECWRKIHPCHHRKCSKARVLWIPTNEKKITLCNKLVGFLGRHKQRGKWLKRIKVHFWSLKLKGPCKTQSLAKVRKTKIKNKHEISWFSLP